jgi:hypothetical protein
LPGNTFRITIGIWSSPSDIPKSNTNTIKPANPILVGSNFYWSFGSQIEE